MPSTIWSGAISFGLVSIPIRVSTAAEDHSISFRRVHLEDMGRVRNRKVCELEDKVVPEHEIGKAYELSKDQLVQVTDEELTEMPLPTAKAIDIVAFINRDDIDPIRLGPSYYLEAAGEVAAKPYILLRKALERSSKAAVAKFALRGRERLGLLSVKEGALVLHSMHWPDEIRSPQEAAPPPLGVELTEDEISGALALMDNMTRDDASGYRDEYRDALEKVIEAKREGTELPHIEGEERPAGGQIVDLMAALNESVAKARESRGEDATVHDMPKKTGKKAPAKKAAKKTAGRKPRSA